MSNFALIHGGVIDWLLRQALGQHHKPSLSSFVLLRIVGGENLQVAFPQILMPISHSESRDPANPKFNNPERV